MTTRDHFPLPGRRLLIGLIAVCLISSANYIVNEWLDRAFDKFHPTKKKLRPSVTINLNPLVVAGEFVLTATAGLLIAETLGTEFFLAAFGLLVMGILYNVEPIRLKDRVYLDVLSESLNNPLRLAMGWFVVTSAALPSLNLVLGYWMGGAFLMAVKRFAEFRFIASHERAGAYRRSFRFYNEKRLLISVYFYALATALFGGIFIFTQTPRLLFVSPFYFVMFAWYIAIGFKPDSIAQHPEQIFREKYFAVFSLLVATGTISCFL